MSEEEAKVAARGDEGRARARTFLVVVDESEELHGALLYACLRAKRTGGRVALLYVIEPVEFQHWQAVGSLMEQERRESAEATLQTLAGTVNDITGTIPSFYVREGNLRDELLALIDEEPAISILILGAATGKEGPGPLVSYLAGKMAGRMRVPITIVPGSLSDDDIRALT
jgi:nucleotide-binding universal stress UspA family protein